MKFNPQKAIRQTEATGLLSGCSLSITAIKTSVSEVTLIKKGLQVRICYSSARAFCYALGILCGRLGEESFEYSKKFATRELGYMADCSRGGVLTVSAVKRLLDILALCGYSYLELYTEDTYTINGEPYFGHMRGRYSAREITEIENYAAVYGMEVVPCIQTMAHLNAMFKWNRYSEINDINDILLCDSDNTYALIDKMIAACRKMFSTDKINIGCDEAHFVGRGKYLDINGYENSSEIVGKHLKKVTEICRNYGFTPYAWGDMFFRSAFGDYRYAEYKEFPDSVKDSVPEGLNLMHWDYYNADENAYEVMLDMFRDLGGGKNALFATGIWRWKGYAPDYELTERTALPAMRVCARKGMENVLVTAWGDDGSECSQFATVGAAILLATADDSGEVSFDEADALCTLATGYTYSELKKLGLPDRTYNGASIVNPHKYILYNDLFVGLFDLHISDFYPELYRKAESELRALAKRGGKFAYMFVTLAELCELLALKCRISLALQPAYERRDRLALGALCADIREMTTVQEKFIQALQSQWYAENKPFGLDVLLYRLGGQLYNFGFELSRLEAFVRGESDSIPELDEPRLEYREHIPSAWTKPNIFANKWTDIGTTGNI